ncbi:MAG: hypothetical protein WCF84_09820 [Anaerolineae bacterium]
MLVRDAGKLAEEVILHLTCLMGANKEMNLSSKQKLWLALVILGLLLCGVLGGLGIGSAPEENGFSLGAPPQPAAKIAAADTGYIVVQTGAGTYYRCADFSAPAACWVPDSAPAQASAQSSDAPQVDDARFAPPPGKIREHWTTTFFDSIGGFITETRYALLEDGTVWVWPYHVHMVLNFPKSVDQFIGAGTGLCCAGLLAVLASLLLVLVFRRKTTPPPQTAQSKS